VVIPLAGTAPLFVLLITYFIPKEAARLHWRLVAGAVMIVLGVMVLTR
jgi:drug/metabolite transporter (DMT)-like permease